MPIKPRRHALDKIEQVIGHLTIAAEIIINDLGPYSERFPELEAVLTPCIMGLDKIIEAIKSVNNRI